MKTKKILLLLMAMMANVVAWATVEMPVIKVNGEVATGTTYDFYTIEGWVSMECETSDAVIYYTLDGTTPSPGNGFRYSTPFEIGEATADMYDEETWEGTYKGIRAIAYVGEEKSALRYCTVAWRGASVEFSHAAGTYTETFDLTLSVRNEGAKIYYSLEKTFDNYNYDDAYKSRSDVHLYEGPIRMNTKGKITVYVLAEYYVVSYEYEGEQYSYGVCSEPAKKTYTLDLTEAPEPTKAVDMYVDGVVSNNARLKLTAPKTVTFAMQEGAAEEFYPVYAIGDRYGNVRSVSEYATRYDGTPLVVDYPCIIRARGYNGEEYSEEESENRFLNDNYVYFGVADYNEKSDGNGAYVEPFTITLHAEGGDADQYDIYYTLGNTPADPTIDVATKYEGEINITESCTLCFVGYNRDTHVYTEFKRQELIIRCATPYITTTTPSGRMNNPIALHYEQFTVTLSHGKTPSSRIYYTLDGTEPTEETGILYDSPIPIDTTCVLTCRAYAEGLPPSLVYQQQLVVKIQPLNIYPVVEGKQEEPLALYFLMQNNPNGNTWQPYFTLDGTDPLTSSTRILGAKGDSAKDKYILNETATVRYVAIDGRSHSEVQAVTYTFKEYANLSFERDTVYTIIGQPFISPIIYNPDGKTLAWTSSDEEVAMVDEDGLVTIVGFGDVIISATFEGDDDVRPTTASYLLIVNVETIVGGQVNSNPGNTISVLTKATRIVPEPDAFVEAHMWDMHAMTINNGKLYASAFWQSNNNSDDSEWWPLGIDALQLCYNPLELSPNWGARYNDEGTDGRAHDYQPGWTLGGLLSIRVPAGKGTIVVRGYTETDEAKMGIMVYGCEPMEFAGGEMRDIVYPYETSEEAYAYIYGISLSPQGRHGYVRSISWVPDGAVFTESTPRRTPITFTITQPASEDETPTVEVGSLIDYQAVDEETTGEVDIPATVEHDGVTYAVTSIGEAAFEGSALTSVILPESITMVGESAFVNCKNLELVDAYMTIPPTLAGVDNGDDDGEDDGGDEGGLTPGGPGEGELQAQAHGTAVKSARRRARYNETSPFFNGIGDNCLLVVPEGCRTAYIEAGWNTEVFARVVERGHEDERTTLAVVLDGQLMDVEGVVKSADGVQYIEIEGEQYRVAASVECPIGDANADGEVSADDIMVEVNAILNLGGTYSQVLSDVNGDGCLSLADVTSLTNIVKDKSLSRGTVRVYRLEKVGDLLPGGGE